MALQGCVLLLFVDGLGLGVADPAVNPLCDGCCPDLAGFLASSFPIDAGLGVPGLPQSATGQTALLTGVNAPREVGRHVEGFPGPRLREIIEEHNVFRRVVAAGGRATFANAYYVGSPAEVAGRRRKSVTTVAALAGLGTLRCRDDMLRNDAVYQDLTRASLRERGYDGPLVTPELSAAHLAAIARRHHLTLFEYFQTDRAGHTGDPLAVHAVLGLLNAFVAALLPLCARDGITLLLTSDHGNVEDLRMKSHTANPVPFGVVGAPCAYPWERRVRALTDVTPAMLAALGAAEAGRSGMSG